MRASILVEMRHFSSTRNISRRRVTFVVGATLRAAARHRSADARSLPAECEVWFSFHDATSAPLVGPALRPMYAKVDVRSPIRMFDQRGRSSLRSVERTHLHPRDLHLLMH